MVVSCRGDTTRCNLTDEIYPDKLRDAFRGLLFKELGMVDFPFYIQYSNGNYTIRYAAAENPMLTPSEVKTLIPIFEKYKTEFQESIKNLKISKGSDNIVRESIKESSWILDSNGYMDLYVSDGKTFYYIDKKEKNSFLRKYKQVSKKYEDEKIKYY